LKNEKPNREGENFLQPEKKKSLEKEGLFNRKSFREPIENHLRGGI